MGLLTWLNGVLAEADDGRDGQDPAARQAPSSSADNQVVQSPNPEWVMPTYRGRAICDWAPTVAALKHDGDYDQALVIATGCMDAMVETAKAHPTNVMEYYVIEVAKIQHKMKAYADEVHTIEAWLGLGLEPPRQDHRIDLQKRLAKANEMWARAEGRDASVHHEEWKRLVEAAKQEKATRTTSGTGHATGGSRPVSSGRSASNARASRRRTALVPTPVQIADRQFVAVDFETANRMGGVSACQLAMVKVLDGQVIDRFNTLIRPPRGWDSFEFTYLHGISAADVQTSPMWPSVADEVSHFVDGAPVYAHNAMFDSRVWRQLDEYFGTVTLPSPFFCSYRTAQRLIRGLPNYKLPTVLQACEPNYHLNHHRADSDAEACALIVCQLQRLASQL